MNRRMELDLMRLLHGDLPEERARELRARLERDPELVGEFRRLQRTWERLSLPPGAPVPPGFSQRILARARSEKVAALSWSSAPGWVRATAAAALVAGTAVGIGVGGVLPLREPAVMPIAQESPTNNETAIDGSLIESYWLAIDNLDDAGTSGSDEAWP